MYDQPHNQAFINKIEKTQYVVITDAIRGISKEKIYAEQGLESLKSRQWFGKLACFHKIQSTGLPKYLLQLMPIDNHPFFLGSLLMFLTITAKLIHSRTDFSKYHKQMRK